MRLLRSKKRGLTRWFAVHEDGSLSFALVGENLSARAVARGIYQVVDVDESVPIAMAVGRSRLRPRLILKLYFKVSQRERERLKWGELRNLKKPIQRRD